MNLMPIGRKDEILRVRVRYSSRWTPASRIALERCLEHADLRPAALPPAAVLLIRRIGDLPAVSLNRRSSGPWEQEARRKIERLYESVARPVFGRVPRDVPAVLFADQAEMLACLLREMVRGTAWEQWWSAAIAQKVKLRTAQPLALLAERPRIMPAVIAQLAQWGDAVTIVRGAAPAEIAECFHALIAEHALAPELMAVFSRTAEIPTTETSAGDSLKNTALQLSAVENRSLGSPAAAPWRRRFPELPSARLSPVHELLLGTLLCTHHEPARTRSAIYARQTAVWAASLAHDVEPVARHQPHFRTYVEPRPTAQSERISPQRHQEPDNSTEPVETTKPNELKPERWNQEPGSFPSRDTASESQQISFAAPLPHEEHARESEPELQRPVFLEQGIETELGGLLFLVNVLEKLNLPDCFEESCRLATQVGPWAVLELIGRALTESLPDDYSGDPIWRVLADLDGRGEGLPGASFRGAETYRIPENWIETTGVEPLWEVDGDRARSWSPAGYVLLERPRETIHCANMSRRLEFSLPRLERAELNPALLCWLRCAMTFIRFRLREALGLNADESIATALTPVRGRVFVTRTHVDLVTGAECASVRVRAAGLDFDPGWSPRMGRIVLFHFG